MKPMQDEKTNVMRILEDKGLEYRGYSYPTTEALSGLQIAQTLGMPPEQVFKTLVTVSGKGSNYVFMIPAAMELDLKKAARAAGEKSIAMLPSKQLLPLTGYVHGGCSPIGMKKSFRTFIDASAENYQTILFSAGRIGFQVEMAPSALAKALSVPLVFAPLTVDGIGG